MKHHPFLAERMDRLAQLCRKHRVARLYVFGSLVSGQFDVKRSDVDLQVELLPIPDPVERGLTLLELWDELEELFGRKVDLVTDQAIRNPFLREKVEKTKTLVYDRPSKEVVV
ncbi:MAG: DNA polymerase subunit beta [Bacteroidetes bacterium]|nr:MAG: DNA polymerase subunit beta [Bacteroidota bacterium]